VDCESHIVVGVSDAKISSDPAAELVTHALGSCIGVALYDPAAQMAGLLHFQLPSAADDPQRAAEKPLMFADSGMQRLVGSMEEHGAARNRMVVKIAGGAEMLDEGKVFNIGRRNHTSIRKILWRYGMLIEAEDVGGSAPRTLYFKVADGKLRVKSGPSSKTL
jgi:chemotaxis protein CheD